MADLEVKDRAKKMASRVFFEEFEGGPHPARRERLTAYFERCLIREAHYALFGEGAGTQPWLSPKRPWWRFW